VEARLWEEKEGELNGRLFRRSIGTRTSKTSSTMTTTPLPTTPTTSLTSTSFNKSFLPSLRQKTHRPQVISHVSLPPTQLAAISRSMASSMVRAGMV